MHGNAHLACIIALRWLASSSRSNADDWDADVHANATIANSYGAPLIASTVSWLSLTAKFQGLRDITEPASGQSLRDALGPPRQMQATILQRVARAYTSVAIFPRERTLA